MSTIPQHLIEKHKEGVETLTFYGVPATELDRDGLLALANCAAQQIQAAHKQFVEFSDMTRFLNRATRRISSGDHHRQRNDEWQEVL